jgi:hypothetical protein
VQEVANVLVDILKPGNLQIQGEEHSQLSKPPFPNLSNYGTIALSLSNTKQQLRPGSCSQASTYKKVSFQTLTGKACSRVTNH